MKPAKEQKVASLENVLTTMAFHLRTLATAGIDWPERGGFGLSAGDAGPHVSVSYVVKPTDPGPLEWGPWAQVTLRDGAGGKVLYQGNRAGAGDALARLYAPVVAAAAAAEAAKAAEGKRAA
jgi:hypothetical protein